MVGVAQLVEPRIVIPVVVGSSPIIHPRFFRMPRKVSTRVSPEDVHGPLAQLVEQWTLNPLVVGSIPTRPTIYHDKKARFMRVFLWASYFIPIIFNPL